MLRLAKGTVTGAALLYAIPLLGWLLFRFWRGESWPMVGLFNAAGIWWFAPLLVLLPVALLVRARQATVMTLLLLLPALWIFGPEFIPAFPRGASPEQPRLRVLSYNVLISNHAYDAVAQLILDARPDVIAIQELSPEMALEISARVGDQYPYRLLYPWSDPRGIGLWSRYPLVEGPALAQGLWERWAQTAVVDVAGQPVYLFNVHLWPIGTLDRQQFARNLRQQHAQARLLQEMVVQVEAPVLVIGDLNASPTNDSYRMLAETLDDAWRQVAFGPGFTWPAPGAVGRWTRPFLRIDYMWTRGGLRPLEMRILPPAGSDHLPLLAEFVVVDAE
jgi:vancomycin resistance protein VanJ